MSKESSYSSRSSTSRLNMASSSPSTAGGPLAKVALAGRRVELQYLDLFNLLSHSRPMLMKVPVDGWTHRHHEYAPSQVPSVWQVRERLPKRRLFARLHANVHVVPATIAPALPQSTSTEDRLSGGHVRERHVGVGHHRPPPTLELDTGTQETSKGVDGYMPSAHVSSQMVPQGCRKFPWHWKFTAPPCGTTMGEQVSSTRRSKTVGACTPL
mmetsp:Transcript_88452/g.235230  ORF Transcript_88452/g.235230 Transcript_88452/m.235230 type:complete len:212 (-) Transcript_88452:2498-3133(-)